jgi:HPt (histidine-containing phosphotransfer) domain-containing protein
MLQRAAHTLKSSSVTLGARALAGRCGELEQLATTQSDTRSSELLRQIEQAYAQTEAALREFHAEAVRMSCASQRYQHADLDC